VGPSKERAAGPGTLIAVSRAKILMGEIVWRAVASGC
jgi:hypothetical protein